MKKCLIFFEKYYEKFSVDLLEVAEKMYNKAFLVYALFVNTDISEANGKFDEIITVTDENIQDYDMKNIVNILEELQTQNNFDSILIPATYFGRMLAPRLAMRLGVGLVADVTQISHYKEDIEMIRPAFDGKVLAGIVNQGKKPVMMSVRPGVFIYEKDLGKKTLKTEFKPQKIYPSNIIRIERQEKQVTKDIRESSVLVAGGGGILQNFDLIDELTKRLGGMKAASRKVVDSGKAERNIQVGQSGKIVNPKLYIALGIYGALQHVAGLNHVEHLIAVNTDQNAPICSLADIVVEGDAEDFVKNLIEKIDNER